jgi:signal transduction histidine kinase
MLRESEARYRRSAIELRARNEEIKNYVSVISHDLRAPLSNIQGFMAELNYDFSALREPVSEWLEQSGNERAGAWKTTWDERIPESIGLIETSVNQMNRRIEALLELARMGRQSIKIMPVDMTRLVKECIRTMAYQAEEKNVKVTCDDLPSVMSDAGIIEQVVGNLLDNAVKYLDPSREGMVHISGQRTPVECRYWIKDNGRGIPRDQCERIFDLFHRAGHRDVKGEGIGLASVRALMHRLGGQIWCESDTGKGAVFVFTLPNVENRDTEKEDNAGV